VLIPARIIAQLIDFLPPGPINLETRENNLLISHRSYKSSVNGFAVEEFPIIPEILEKESVTIPNLIFCQAIEQVVDIAAVSAARPEISGVYFVFQKDLIKIVATDSFRLGEQKIFLKNSLSQEYSFILPQQAAKEVVNIFGQKEGDIKIYFSPNQIMFEAQMQETARPQIQLVSRLIDGSYPNYEDIIPEKTSTQVKIPKAEFLNMIKPASLFAGKTNEISFRIDPKKETIAVSSQNQDLGEYQSSAGAKIKGKEIDISFNCRFLIDGLLKIKSPEVLFELTDGDGKAILKPTGEENFLYIAMPIKKN
jgi:DNA polymerase III subunit beta